MSIVDGGRRFVRGRRRRHRYYYDSRSRDDKFSLDEPFSLEMAVYIAREEAEEIMPDLWQIFSLFFVWKYYKFAVSSAIFGVFVPATAFVSIYKYIFGCCARKLRFYVAVLTWFGILGAIIYFLVSMGSNNVKMSVFLGFISAILAVQLVFFALLFFGFACGCDAGHEYAHQPFDRDTSKTHVSNVLDTKFDASNLADQIFERKCNKYRCDTTCIGDFLENIDKYYDQMDELLIYNYRRRWWYNSTCAICNEYQYKRDIVYHCRSCQSYYCNRCASTHLRLTMDGQRKKQQNSDNDSNLNKIVHKVDNSRDEGTIIWAYCSDAYIPRHLRFS